MALIDQYTLSQDIIFHQRCQQGALEVATTVYQEADTVPFHSERKLLADLVINTPSKYGALFAALLSSVASIATAAGSPANQGNVTDTQIRNVISQAWNTIAGAAA